MAVITEDRGSIHGAVVVKLGGEVVASPHLAPLANDVRELVREGVPVVVVHGGGAQATDLQKRLGQTPKMVGGRRITDSDALDVMKMTLAGKVNVDLCAGFLAAGARPVGLHGASSCIVHATKRPPRVVSGGGPEPIDFGFVGDVDGVNTDLLSLLLGGHFVPIIACLGADDAGNVFNINADVVANKMALAVKARALVLVSDVRGVLRSVEDPTSRISHLTIAEAERAIQDGVVTKGMIPKVEESCASIRAGVKAVHIVGRLGPGELARELREPGSIGTVLCP